MAKGQKRSNREIKKPKKQKEPVAVPAGSVKGLSASFGASSRKGGGAKA